MQHLTPKDMICSVFLSYLDLPSSRTEVFNCFIRHSVAKYESVKVHSNIFSQLSFFTDSSLRVSFVGLENSQAKVDKCDLSWVSFEL